VFDLACACAGVVFTPLETSSLPAVLDLCVRTGARAVLTTPDRTGPYDGRPIVAEDGRAASAGDPALAITRLGERAGHRDGNATYMLQPTSGTTGGSKLVMRHHAVFVRIAQVFGFGLERAREPPARFLMVAALTHGMGQYLLSIAMSLAAELCVTTRIDVGADLHEIRSLDPTYFGLTPRVLRSLVQQLGGVGHGERIFGPSARFLLNGGAAPDNDLLAAVERSGVHVVNSYGASEFSIVAMTRPGHWRPDLLGHVLSDVTLRVTEEDELEARTPEVSRSGAFVELDGPIRPGRPITVEVIAAEGQGFLLDAELVRQEAAGCAIRWTGPAAISPSSPAGYRRSADTDRPAPTRPI
jgi:acyl-CoA synthetase (AMP-forming)/AMP-acid ligase II